MPEDKENIDRTKCYALNSSDEIESLLPLLPSESAYEDAQSDFVFLAFESANGRGITREDFLENANAVINRRLTLPATSTFEILHARAGDKVYCFGWMTRTNRDYGFVVILVAPNTGPGAPWGTIATANDGQEIRNGGWQTLRWTATTGGLTIFLRYADNTPNDDPRLSMRTSLDSLGHPIADIGVSQD
jgi:hypothetical protein